MKKSILKFNINQLLDQNTKCTDILAIMLDFNLLESQLYFHLLQKGERTVNRLCKETERENSTVSRALQKLVTQGICMKTKHITKPRGYQYVYSAMNPDIVKEILFNRLERLYECTSNCIKDFEIKSISCEISF